MLIETTFLGVHLERNLLTSLYEATQIEDDFLTLQGNIIINIRPSRLLSKENLISWKNILKENGQSTVFSEVIENVLDFSTALLNDVKLNAESSHIVAVVAKSILINIYKGYSIESIDNVTINTALEREEKIDALRKAINPNDIFAFSSLELAEKSKLDEKFCKETYDYKKELLENDEIAPDFKYTKSLIYRQIKLDILNTSKMMIEENIVNKISNGDDVDKDSRELLQEIIQDKIILNVLSNLQGDRTKDLAIIRSLKSHKLNYITSTNNPYYTIYTHIVLYYFEMAYILDKHKDILGSIHNALELFEENAVENIKDYFTKVRQVTLPMYSLYITINKKFGGIKNKHILSLLSTIAGEHLQQEYNTISNLVHTIFYGKVDNAKNNKITDMDKSYQNNLYNISFDRFQEYIA